MENNNLDRFKFRVAVKQDDGSYKVFEAAEISYNKQEIRVTFETKRPFSSPLQHLRKYEHKIVDGENVILLQCTGWKDDENILMYAGDILKIKYDDGFECKEVVEVINNDLTIDCEFLNENYSTTHIDFLLDEELHVEIIGNRYENPELLGGAE
ncbi:YopX family protein [Lentisphaerota bacterium WC36G]|nr:YopX family protein [Lentisphaerae bacterium WC36]UDQ99411.1 YopX family protein [Lentisphaerae bacterium WC36]